MKRLAVSLTLFLVLSLGVGVLVSGSEFLDWGIAGGVFAIAVLGECFRFWIHRTRSKRRDSSSV